MTRDLMKFYLVLMPLLAWSVCSFASERGNQHLLCLAETSDQELSAELQPSRDVFAMQYLNFENGHRIALQWLDQPNRLKTYVYDDSKKRLVLLNSQVYLLGEDLKGTAYCGQRIVDARSYSGAYEREVILQCEWLCGSGVQP